MDIYEFQKVIGNGMFGQVFLAKHKIEDKLYAIKRINFKDINKKDIENIENEVGVLQELKHPNVVSYKDSFFDKDNYFHIVMIYCEGGDFYEKIKNSKGKFFKEEEIIEWIVQLGLALSYVHDKKILHRDFKTQNIFLKEGRIRIGDFGIAKIFNQTKDLAGSMVGTPLYMSPELYNGKKYGFKSDIWSFGCCLYEICNLKHAFEGLTWNAVAIKVVKGTHNPVNSIYSKELRGLIDQMLSVNPKNRPTISTILEKPFIKKKVANYIYDFINSNKSNKPESKTNIEGGGDILNEQCEILKEQAEKLGVFNMIIKDINGITYSNVNSNAIGISYPSAQNDDNRTSDQEKENLKSNNSHNNNPESNNIVKYESNESIKLKYDDYLKKKREEQKKIEEILAELEKKKKLIFTKIKNKIIPHKSRENSGSLDSANHQSNKHDNPSNIHKIPSEYNSNLIEISYLNNLKINNYSEDTDKKSQLKFNKAQFSTAYNKQNNLKRPETSNHYKSNRKISDGDLEKGKEVNLINRMKKKIDDSRSKSPKEGLRDFKNLRPSTGLKNLQKGKKEVEEIDEEILLETICEEKEKNLLIEKDNLKKVTQEIKKMKECLEKTQNKIEKIFIRINQTEEKGDHQNLNKNILNENEETSDISENENAALNNHNHNNLNPNINLKYRTIESLEDDDGTAILREKIKQFRQRCESALGHKLFIKAYDYLKSNRVNTDPNVIREHLISKIMFENDRFIRKE